MIEPEQPEPEFDFDLRIAAPLSWARHVLNRAKSGVVPEADRAYANTILTLVNLVQACRQRDDVEGALIAAVNLGEYLSELDHAAELSKGVQFTKRSKADPIIQSALERWPHATIKELRRHLVACRQTREDDEKGRIEFLDEKGKVIHRLTVGSFTVRVTILRQRAKSINDRG